MKKSKDIFLEEQIKGMDESLNRMMQSYDKMPKIKNYFIELQGKLKKMNGVLEHEEDTFDWSGIESMVDEILIEDPNITDIRIDMNLQTSKFKNIANIKAKIR